MKTLPVEFRRRVISLTEEGYSSGEIAEVLGTSAAWVRSIKQLHAAGEPLEPKSRANKRRSLAEREGERIRTQVAAKPSTTLEDLKRDLKLTTSISNLWYALQELKISLKKKPSPPPNERDPMWPSPARSGPSSRPASTRVV
jgi:transposase